MGDGTPSAFGSSPCEGERGNGRQLPLREIDAQLLDYPISVIAALRRGNLAVCSTDVRAQGGEIPAASAGMTECGCVPPACFTRLPEAGIGNVLVRLDLVRLDLLRLEQPQEFFVRIEVVDVDAKLPG